PAARGRRFAKIFSREINWLSRNERSTWANDCVDGELARSRRRRLSRSRRQRKCGRTTGGGGGLVMMQEIIQLWFKSWRSIIEIILLSVGIYYGYLYFRGTRGAKVLTGLAIVFLTLTLISTLLNLVVIGWILRSSSVCLAIALVVIFQPELRRGLAELGGHPIFSLTSEK